MVCLQFVKSENDISLLFNSLLNIFFFLVLFVISLTFSIPSVMALHQSSTKKKISFRYSMNLKIGNNITNSFSYKIVLHLHSCKGASRGARRSQYTYDGLCFFKTLLRKKKNRCFLEKKINLTLIIRLRVHTTHSSFCEARCAAHTPNICYPLWKSHLGTVCIWQNANLYNYLFSICCHGFVVNWDFADDLMILERAGFDTK